MVERLFYTQVVAGSSPVSPTMIDKESTTHEFVIDVLDHELRSLFPRYYSSTNYWLEHDTSPIRRLTIYCLGPDQWHGGIYGHIDISGDGTWITRTIKETNRVTRWDLADPASLVTILADLTTWWWSARQYWQWRKNENIVYDKVYAAYAKRTLYFTLASDPYNPLVVIWVCEGEVSRSEPLVYHRGDNSPNGLIYASQYCTVDSPRTNTPTP